VISRTHTINDRPRLESLVDTIVSMAQASDVVWSVRREGGSAHVTVSGPTPQVDAVMEWLERE
jgi:hypothetical protein